MAAVTLNIIIVAYVAAYRGCIINDSHLQYCVAFKHYQASASWRSGASADRNRRVSIISMA